VREVLLGLRSRDPSPLSGYPDPRESTSPPPPFSISLWAWAADEAAELDRQFGGAVELTVGAFSYPGLTREPDLPAWRPDVRPLADEAGLPVALAEPLVLRSGHSRRPDVLVSNASHEDLTIRTNRQLQSRVVGPDGAEVGGYVGPQRMPGVSFEVAVGATVAIPVLIGTDSLDPALGYAVPPGSWFLQVHLDLRDGRRLRSSPLPIDIIA
jgi:hypothetical protein